MTRKHFQAIADAMAASRPEDYPGTDIRAAQAAAIERRQWRTTRTAIANALAASNPRFDRDRFDRATEA